MDLKKSDGSTDKINILFVDDEPSLCEQAKIFLEKKDERFEVTTTTSAKKGLERLEKEKFDAVVSDYFMSEMNGIEFLENIREKGKEIPFIVLTGKGREEVVMKVINRRGNHYVQKENPPSAQYDKIAHAVIKEIKHYRTKKELQKREKKYRTLFEKNPVGLIECDSDGNIMNLNERMVEILGNPDKERVSGKNISELSKKDDSKIKEDFDTAMKEKRILDEKKQIITPWGKEIRMSYRILPLTNENNQATGATVACYDVIFY